MLISMFFISPSSQTLVGTWKMIDDESGEAKSVIKIFKAKDGLYYGKIIEILDKDAPKDAKCIRCPKNDYRYNKPIKGLVILSKLKTCKSKKIKN